MASMKTKAAASAKPPEQAAAVGAAVDVLRGETAKPAGSIRGAVVDYFTKGPGREALEKALQSLVADPATSAPIKKRARRTLEQLRAGR